MNYRVLLFYKYVHVKNPHKFLDEHISFCNEHEIRGRVFIAEEGINGTVSGKAENIELYKANLKSYPEFTDIIFKEDVTDKHAFRKIHVRIKQEIVNSSLLNISPLNGGKRLLPEGLLNFYESGKEFVIIDARNWYESKIGKFKNALSPPLKNFREWAGFVESLKGYEDKTIVTYCTGGIRCEKASALLVEKGFNDVYQLDGGIVTYTKKYPDTYWEGGIWVFDERRVVEPNTIPELKTIASCYFCEKPTSYYINCHNQDCDKILVCCHECKVANDYCCSDECRKSPNRRQRVHG